MNDLHGYYAGCLEVDGFKTPFIVYASSGEHAVAKALDEIGYEQPGARVFEIQGPYQSLSVLET